MIYLRPQYTDCILFILQKLRMHTDGVQIHIYRYLLELFSDVASSASEMRNLEESLAMHLELFKSL